MINMSKMLTLAFILGIILLGMLTLASNIQQVKAIGTVYIRADGSIDPPTAPIQRNGDLYTLTGNITSDSAGIVIERNNIVLDGAGYTVQFFGVHSSSDQAGIILTDRSQVTVKNVNIKEFVTGMQVFHSIDLNISGNNLISNLWGVYLWDSHDSTISENNLTENGDHGIYLDGSSNNNITRNNMANSGLRIRIDSPNNRILENTFINAGLYVYGSLDSIVEGNTVNGRPLVYLDGASDRTVDDAGQLILIDSNNIKVENLSISNTSYALQLLRTNNSIITNNNFVGNAGGISLRGSSNNSIVRNKIVAGTEVGIYLSSFSSNNSIVENNVTDNHAGVWLGGSPGNSITENNITASGWSGLYLGGSNYNRVFRNNLVDNNYGIRFDSSQGNNVYENNITASEYSGLSLSGSSDNNTVSRNSLADNNYGISFSGFSSGNNVFENNITQNHEYGIYLEQSSGNKFYHNNFVGNTNQGFAYDSVNVWDDGYFSGGNYWSDYSVTDEKSGSTQDQPGSDGIRDIPHSLAAGNSDRYPLVDIYSIVPSYPIAVFTYSPSDPISGQIVVFNASNSTSENGTITTYYWSFGDGAFSGGSGTTHEYASYGDYKITLTVVSNSRLLSNQTRLIYVRERPIASFQVFPVFNLSAGQAITFNASLSNPRGGNITDYIWNFGDGNTTSTAEPVVTYTYSQAITYNVTLTVQDSEDLNSSYFQMIKVWMPTSISISTSPSSTFVGFAAVINGTLYDVYGNGLENQTVVLYYTFPGANTWVPITSDTTDQLGKYYVNWIPPATGYFTVKAIWTGNATHFEANNTISLSILPYQNEYVFSVTSNSTVSTLSFDSESRELNFDVTGPSGTIGYVNVFIAKGLIADIEDIEVKLNDEEVDFAVTSLDDSWLLHFTYLHSTHEVTISLGRVSAPFIESLLGGIIIFAIVSITVIVIIVLFVLKRKLKSNQKEPVTVARS